jgi:hypothetical protein
VRKERAHTAIDRKQKERAHNGIDSKQKIFHNEINAAGVAGSMWKSGDMTVRLHLKSKRKLGREP